jgi:nucleoside-diphosphate-sugar epimerase
MTQESLLLIGGAGYIGAHIADEFIRAGKSVVIYDSLYQGLEHRIQYLRTKHNMDIPLIKADIRDYNELEGVIRTYKIERRRGDTLEAVILEGGFKLLAGRRAWEAENGPSPKKLREKASGKAKNK